MLELKRSRVWRAAHDFPLSFTSDTVYFRARLSAVTQILDRAADGDPKAGSELLLLVYDELRRLAAHRLASERNQHTLQPTALVHEAWLKLSAHPQRAWNGRQH